MKNLKRNILKSSFIVAICSLFALSTFGFKKDFKTVKAENQIILNNQITFTNNYSIDNEVNITLNYTYDNVQYNYNVELNKIIGYLDNTNFVAKIYDKNNNLYSTTTTTLNSNNVIKVETYTNSQIQYHGYDNTQIEWINTYYIGSNSPSNFLVINLNQNSIDCTNEDVIKNILDQWITYGILGKSPKDLVDILEYWKSDIEQDANITNLLISSNNNTQAGNYINWDFYGTVYMDLESVIINLREQVNLLTQQYNNLQNVNNILSNQVIQLNSQVSNLQNQLSTLQSQYDSSQANLSNANQTITTLNSQIASLQNQVTQYQSQISNLNSQLTSINNQLVELTTTNNTLSAQNELLTQSNSTLQSQVEQLHLDVQSSYSDGYTVGYNEGVSLNSTASTIFNGILNIALVPINMFLAMFNFDILGINMSGFISGILTVCIVIIILKTVTGKGSGGDSE